MITLNKGTKEVLPVVLTDAINSITTLDGINVEQRIITEDESAEKQAWATIFETDGMRADCLIDTTNWTEGTYKLFIRINVPPELPILGPFEFAVS